jgi:hypothetical protein
MQSCGKEHKNLKRKNNMNSISFFKALLMKELNEKKLSDKQKDIADEAPPKNKITRADFKALQAKKGMKKEDYNLGKKVDTTELEMMLKKLKKDNPGKKVTYSFIKDSPKGYVFYIDKEGEEIAALKSKVTEGEDHEVGIDPSSQSMAKKFLAIKNILKKGYKNSKIEDVERYREGINFTISFITDINNEEYLKLIAELEAAIGGDDAITSDYEDRVIYVELLPPYTGKDESKVMKEGEDHEVSMAHNSLKSIVSSASQLMNLLGNDEKDIPAWIQDHITNAENFINQASKNYHEYNEGEHDMDELPYGPEELPAGDAEDLMSLKDLMETIKGKKKRNK